MSSTVPTMERHALAILGNNDLWNWPDTKQIQASGKHRSKFRAATPKFLRELIVESQRLGGWVLDHFWTQLGACDVKLKENIECLKVQDFVSAKKSFEVLFQGLDPKNINFLPVLAMTDEFFTQLGIALLNSGGRKSGTSTALSITEVVKEKVDKIIERANEAEKLGNQNQVYLKALAFERDGITCLLTGVPFRPHDEDGYFSELTHIIPNSVHGKPDTLKCIAMFAGVDAANDVEFHLNKIGNVMNMEHNLHTSYGRLEWGIEATELAGGNVKYVFRTIPKPRTLKFLTLKDGDEIQFGRGDNGEMLGRGPLPRLCNLQLAVTRALQISGAAEMILEWKDDADDAGCYRLSIDCEEHRDMLDAKLFLSGRATIFA